MAFYLYIKYINEFRKTDNNRRQEYKKFFNE